MTSGPTLWTVTTLKALQMELDLELVSKQKKQ
jgi:hypothetical protein